MSLPNALLERADRLCRALAPLRFARPVTHVYNPLEYARAPYQLYLQRYAKRPKRVVFFGMNPGPFGMSQTGVPFGEVTAVRDWLGIEAAVGRPAVEHPKRPITGFSCARSEVSGARLWGLWKSIASTPQRFFSWGFVVNYCPLVFMEESGRNLTPDKLAPKERAALYAPCDEHIAEVVRLLAPEWVVGVGKFAEGRARAALAHLPSLRIASMPHPSPANPNANRNWGEAALAQLRAAGLDLLAM